MITQTSLYPPQPNTARASSTFISYDSQNNRIAYASGRSIVVRSLNSDRLPVQFTKHTFPTTVATFSPSGNYIASGDESGNVKIWDSSVYGKEEGSFEQPVVKAEYQILSGPIRSIAWDGDNQRVIAVGEGKDQFGHCFTWDSGNSVGEIQGHSTVINAVDIKPQRPYRAATVSADKALVFYNGPPFKFDKSIRGRHKNVIRDVKFSPDGKWLVSVGSDRTIVVYDGKTGEVSNTLEDAHNGGIFGVSWLADSSAFVTASADNTLKAWNPENLESKHTYTVDADSTVSNQQVGVVVTKEYVISLSLNGNLNFFKHSENAPTKKWYGHQKSITSVSSDDKNVYTGDADGLIVRWDRDDPKLGSTPEILGNREDQHTNYVDSIVKTDGGIVTAGWDDKLKLWTPDGAVVKTAQLDYQPKHLAFAYGRLFVAHESAIASYDAASLEKISVNSINFKASYVGPISETKVLVANSSGSKVEELELGANLKTVRSYQPLRSAPSLIKVSPDGQYAAVADTAGKYTLYNTSDGSVVTTRWAFHNSRVEDAEWTADSKFLLSGGLDSSLFVYSVARPMKVLKFPLAHQNGVTGVKWIDYDQSKGVFVSTGSDGFVKSWTADFSVYA
ncbi:uncharacterized protein CXQ87_000781 [Candidozyma duobushaemuli]|uniref:Uncharacterized protein n=2 Tax=Candidozyma TaxID=3303203 RepID=A0ABX8I3K3_9ASCO|nr:uncharacterized protein CXQ87_000781 [[Candida] duobushaemulonis]PVH17880.1 hypothetical protein CXQ87_000781 [[Candida] duobushaemulonis]QWU86463.1 hypothetical protein CA3LBN_000681 [[Candida] haemuloni]